ncbi:MAG TPA: hypothetical protein VGN12_16510 [Pirellulales bacterium]|jgi:hypothetical protein
MLPENLVLDRSTSPKNFDELMEELATTYCVRHEQTTLEMIRLSADGTVQTPSGAFQLTRDFLESSANFIGMPKTYAYRISPELFIENFRRRQAETTAPITVCSIGDVAIGLVNDRRSRYRPANTMVVLRELWKEHQFEFRRASVSYAGVDVELVRPGLMVEPVVGDTVEIGIAVTNSESGDRQLKASAYSYRLVCTNGAMMTDDLGVARWPSDPRMTPAGCQRAFLREVTALCGELASVGKLYRVTFDRPVPDVAFTNVWRRVNYVLPRGGDPDAVLGISAEERRGLQEMVRQRDASAPPALTRWTVYEVHNRLTHAAHGQPFKVRRGLQELGGQFLSYAAEWPPLPSAN